MGANSAASRLAAKKKKNAFTGCTEKGVGGLKIHFGQSMQLNGERGFVVTSFYDCVRSLAKLLELELREHD